MDLFQRASGVPCACLSILSLFVLCCSFCLPHAIHISTYLGDGAAARRDYLDPLLLLMLMLMHLPKPLLLHMSLSLLLLLLLLLRGGMRWGRGPMM